MSASAFTMPTAHLARGKACVPCRGRKMKCDGTQPVCNQCTRFNRAQQCEFNEGPFPSTVRVLQQRIARLQLRIEELEDEDQNQIRLHAPYCGHALPGMPTWNQPSDCEFAGTENWWEALDPPLPMRHRLVRYFLPHSAKFGFFLNKDRFQVALNQPTPPLPVALRHAIYLWAINLSGNSQNTVAESSFLSRAARGLHNSLEAVERHEGNLLMALQAEILLSQYFFHCNRLLEGRFHASAAMSLAVLCNLPNGLPETAAQAPLPPPIDAVEQDERKEAWLATLTLDKTWAVALSVPSPLVQKEENVVPTQVDSPWFPSPRECSLHPAALSGTWKVSSYVAAGVAPVLGSSPFTLLAEVSSLYDKADCLGYYHSGDPTFRASLSALDSSIEKFKALLPSYGSSQSDESASHNHLLASCICHCATIQLHRPLLSSSTASMNRCVTSTVAVVQLLSEISVRMKVVNPIIGVIAMTAAEMLVHVLRSIRSMRIAWAVGPVLLNEVQCVGIIQNLVVAMQNLAQYPFIAAQARKLSEIIPIT